MIKKERRKKKRQILQIRKLYKMIEATNNKFYWVSYKSLRAIGVSYSKHLCPTKRYRLRRFKEIVILLIQIGKNVYSPHLRRYTE